MSDISGYINSVTAIKRGNYKGIFSNAKPLFVLSLIKLIELGYWEKNEIYYDDYNLKDIFDKMCNEYNEPQMLFRYPFFHLTTESFYNISWKPNVKKPRASESPSSKFLKDNINFAYLDSELWDLLQIRENREILKKAILDKYFPEQSVLNKEQFKLIYDDLAANVSKMTEDQIKELRQMLMDELKRRRETIE